MHILYYYLKFVELLYKKIYRRHHGAVEPSINQDRHGFGFKLLLHAFLGRPLL